jgi:hypothetical protein
VAEGEVERWWHKGWWNRGQRCKKTNEE